METNSSNGAWSPRKSLSATEAVSPALQILLLTLAGMLVVYLASAVRLPIKMPGRHGIELMAILVLCRSGSSLRWAATTAGLSAMCTSLFGSSADADGGITAAIHFPLVGLIVDLAWRRISPETWWGVLMAVVAGLAHMSKPLLRSAVGAVVDLHYGSLVQGLAYPAATHFLFGFVGAWTALLALRARHALDKKG